MFAYKEKFKEFKDNKDALIKINKAKDCLMDFASRTRYNEALDNYGVTDGAGLTTGLQEVPTPTDYAAAETEHSFEVTNGDEIAEFTTPDLEGLQKETGDCFELAPGSF